MRVNWKRQRVVSNNVNTFFNVVIRNSVSIIFIEYAFKLSNYAIRYTVSRNDILIVISTIDA